MADETKGEIVSEKEALATGRTAPGLWLEKIKRAKADEKDWHLQASEAVAIYEADEKAEGGVPAFNILHSNIEITVPSLYNSTPIPDVRRRWGDPDPVSKVAVDVIERALGYAVDTYDFDGHMLEATRDAEITGRGQIRIRYKPEMIAATSEDGEEYEDVGNQKVTIEHIPWDKWGHGPARSWEEVPWVYFEHDLTHDDLLDLKVPESRIRRLAFDDSDTKASGESEREKASTGVMKTVRAYEIWDKRSKKVYFVPEHDPQSDEYLSEQDDPLQLETFFPCPKPMQPLRRRKNLTPLVPYTIYKTQVAELDKVTKRINGLIGQLKVRGLYDKRLGADFERLKFCDDGQYEPADDATMFAQGGGGLEKAIAHWPLAEIVGALQQLYVQRDQIKQTIYEVTGLSDVLRGATDPNETLGAQQLKAQNGSTRLSQRQRMAADMSRDLFRVQAEIFCNHYTTQNLSMMTGIQIPPEVEQVLRSDLMRSYKIDIESDSTVRADLARTQEQMTLFLQGTGQYATAMAPIMQMQPGSKEGIIEIYAAFARHFKLGKSAEDALDRMIEAAKQPQEPPPNPEVEKMKMEQEKMKLQAQMDKEKQQGDMAKQQAELQIKQQMAEIDRRTALEQMEIKRRGAIVDLKVKVALAKLQLMQAGTKGEGEDGESSAPTVSLSEDEIMDAVQVGPEAEDPAIDELRQALMQIAAQQTQIMRSLNAPKRMQIERDPSGKVAGVTVMPETLQ